MITWTIFFSIIGILLFLDLYVFNKKPHLISVKESLILSAFYISVALIFGLWVWYSMGIQHSSDYYTGYLVELSLSLDNLFVISLIFKHFKVPKIMHHQILFWGILGVIVLRGIMISLGALLVSRFEWVLYIFSAFLIFVGVKMFFAKENKKEFSEGFFFKFFAKHLNPSSKHYFWWIVLMIEAADLMFAIDSIPAIFAITTNPYIVYTSNIFAVVGLRSMYFALDAVLDKFIYLQHALALVLIFIGGKIFVADFMGLHKIPSGVSLSVTFLLLAGGIVLSIVRKPRGKTSISP